MSLVYFLKLLVRNLKWLLIIPCCLAFSIWYFTRHEQKIYSSETVIYTGIASGYSLNGNSKADYFTASNAFDNLLSIINSRETKKEAALRLLAAHLNLRKHDPALLSWGAYSELQNLVPDSLRKKLVRERAADTYQRLVAYMNQSEVNLVYRIINGGNAYYSISALNKIKSNRVNSSDLIKIAYETTDAAICRHTLQLILEVFMNKHRLIKEGQSESVVAYFEQQTKDAYQRLDAAESDFLHFNTSNNIINYQEQTKAVAGEREGLYRQNHNMEMEDNAADVSLREINQNLEGRRYQALFGADVLQEREELASIYNRIAVAETLDKNEGTAGPQKALDSLRAVAAAKERHLQGTLAKLYEKTNTPNGIPTREVLNQWLETMLAYERSKARLAVMDKRKKEFEEEYRKYAPLGAMLKKIERKINVQEREYLEMLHNLNVARLQQQNNELTTKLNVVDEPYLPLAPNPSKRMILVAVGFIAGFVIVLAGILARALMNQTLQQPQRANRVIGLPLLGVYPLQHDNPAFVAKARLRLLQHLLPHLPAGQPACIGFVSIQKGEGKTTLLEIVRSELQQLTGRVSVHQWEGALPSCAGESGITLIEFPALDEMVIGPSAIPQLQFTVLVCRANRIWSKLDRELLRMFTKTTGNIPAFVLNGASADFAEEVIGEIPKKRTLVRTVTKRLAKAEFGNRNALARTGKEKKAAGEDEVKTQTFR